MARANSLTAPGISTSANGVTICSVCLGLRNLISHLDGTGRMMLADGTVYVGQWEQGKRHGWGRLDYKNGSYYEGTWESDTMSGEGRLVAAAGMVYRYEGDS